MKISILICSFAKSNYLEKTMDSIVSAIPKEYETELLIDVEEERTGLVNTPKRYMDLWRKSEGEIIIKSDDDVEYVGDSNSFNLCIKESLNKDTAYVSPISHFLMQRLGVKHAYSDSFPIYAKDKLFQKEVVLSGMCWIMKRSLFEAHPYTVVGNTWHLDSIYANYVHKKGLRTIAYQGALIKHLGGTRYKGTVSDRPGQPASEEFKKQHPEYNYKIF